MKYHKQIFLYAGEDSPDAIAGSCYPTVIACLLDKELMEMPHFNILFWNETEKKNLTKVLKNKFLHKSRIEKYGEDFCQEQYRSKLNQYLEWSWFNVLEAYLYSQGVEERRIPDIDKWLKDNSGKPYTATGKSPRGVLHVVIYQDGKMIHDPHPSNDGLVEVEHYDELVDVLEEYPEVSPTP